MVNEFGNYIWKWYKDLTENPTNFLEKDKPLRNP